MAVGVETLYSRYRHLGTKAIGGTRLGGTCVDCGKQTVLVRITDHGSRIPEDTCVCGHNGSAHTPRKLVSASVSVEPAVSVPLPVP
eukprot:scaffold34137_cov112-Isochrysis_galbana.AAC.2